MNCGTHSRPTGLKKLSVDRLGDRPGSTPLMSGILGGSVLSQLRSTSLSTRGVTSMSGFSAV
jgi:hypothetical protein